MITVLLATRNRRDRLALTLESLCRLRPPSSGWALVVIDNGSSDGTKDLLAEFGDRLPLTVLIEPRPGRSVALNCALAGQIADGLVVFTDDDVDPEPDWLARYEEAADTNPAYSMFGGTILPNWEVEPPSWVLDWVHLDVCFGILDFLDEGPCPHYRVYGANMAIRSEVLYRGYRLMESIGPSGSSSYVQGCESQLVRRLADDGHLSWHCKRAVVRHFIPRENLTEHWFFRRAGNYGRGQYALGADAKWRPGASGLGFSARAWLGVAASFLGASRARLKGDREARFKALWRMNYLIGMADQHRTARAAR